MHQVFRIEEIASEIVRYLNLNDLSRVLTTCKALHAPALTAIWLRQESLSALTELLPKDLVVENDFHDLCVWDSTTTQELYSESQITILDKDHRIYGRRLDELPNEDEEEEGAEVEEDEEMPLDGDITTDEIVQVAEPTDSPPIQQHVLIFNRAPIEEELQPMLRRSFASKRLRYRLSDYKGFLIIHSLMRLYPHITFFPSLKEIIIVPPIHSMHARESRGILVPFSILQGISSLIIDGVPYYRRTRPIYDGPEWRQGESGDLKVMGDISSTLSSLSASTWLNLRHFGLLMDLQDHESIREQYNVFRHAWVPTSLPHFLRSTCLQSVRLAGAPVYRTWLALSSLSGLQELELGQSDGGYLGGYDIWPEDEVIDQTHSNYILFPALQTLRCQQHAICDDLTRTFKLMHFPNLHTAIFFNPLHLESQLAVIPLLRDFPHEAPALRHLSIDFSAPTNWSDEHRLRALEPSDFHPLPSNCRQLEHFHFSLPKSCPITLDNDCIVRMANAWPGLTYLYLDPLNSSSSLVTMEGLVPFARCPNLKDLVIGLNTTAVHVVYPKDMYLAELGNRAPCALSRLSIGAPWVQDTATCAEFLSCIFPHIQEVELPPPEQCDPIGGRMYAWTKVVRLVKELNAGGKVAKTEETLLDLEDDEEYYYDDEDNEDVLSVEDAASSSE